MDTKSIDDALNIIGETSLNEFIIGITRMKQKNNKLNKLNKNLSKKVDETLEIFCLYFKLNEKLQAKNDKLKELNQELENEIDIIQENSYNNDKKIKLLEKENQELWEIVNKENTEETICDDSTLQKTIEDRNKVIIALKDKIAEQQREINKLKPSNIFVFDAP